MKNYNLPNLTDADNQSTWVEAYRAFTKALHAHPPTTDTQLAIRYIAQRAYGHATTAQALLLLATLGPQAPCNLPHIDKVDNLLADRLSSPATCTQTMTVKELYTLIHVLDGTLKQAHDKLAFIAQADQATLQRAIRQLTGEWHKNAANVILPGEGVGPGKYLRGWLRINELFPPVRDKDAQAEDVITNLF